MKSIYNPKEKHKNKWSGITKAYKNQSVKLCGMAPAMCSADVDVRNREIKFLITVSNRCLQSVYIVHIPNGICQLHLQFIMYSIRLTKSRLSSGETELHCGETYTIMITLFIIFGIKGGLGLKCFNATFNNISVIS